MTDQLQQDVSAASASYLLELLPALLQLPPQEAYERLTAHIATALLAYCDALKGWRET